MIVKNTKETQVLQLQHTRVFTNLDIRRQVNVNKYINTFRHRFDKEQYSYFRHHKYKGANTNRSFICAHKNNSMKVNLRELREEYLFELKLDFRMILVLQTRSFIGKIWPSTHGWVLILPQLYPQETVAA